MADRQTLRVYALLAIVLIVAPTIGAVASTLNRAAPPIAEAAPEATIRDHLLPATAPPAAAVVVAADAGPAAPGSEAPAEPRASVRDRLARSEPAPAPVEAVERVEQATAPAEEPAAAPEPAAIRSILPESQVVVFYGLPRHRGLGILGWFPPEESARRVRDQAAAFDVINGDRPVVGALDIIYGLVQSEPTSNGMYVRHLDDRTVNEWIALAEEYDVQLILDLQIGRAGILDEVRRIERFLLNPRVHVAIDPEYAVGPQGIPIATPGRISGHVINDVQGYLDDLVKRHKLPRKMLIIHQYMNATITDGEATTDYEDVDLVLNMDAFGAVHEKRKKYEMFANRPYAEHASYNVFLKLDERVSSEHEILSLSPQPDVIFYQ
jgi:hypothetical protein